MFGQRVFTVDQRVDEQLAGPFVNLIGKIFRRLAGALFERAIIGKRIEDFVERQDFFLGLRHTSQYRYGSEAGNHAQN